MKNSKIIKILKKYHAINHGHFEFDSSLHGASHFEKRNLITYPDAVNVLSKYLARKIKAKNIKFDLVCSPAIGGIPIGYLTALRLNVPFIFLEFKPGKIISIRKNFCAIIKGRRILFIDDNRTSGKTLLESSKLLKSLGGNVVLAGFIASVDENSKNNKIPYISLYRTKNTAWTKEKCPLCRKNIPLVDRDDISGYVIKNIK